MKLQPFLAKALLALTFVLPTVLAASTQAPLRPPAGWDTRLRGPAYLPGDQAENAYDTGRDTKVRHSGHASLTIRSVSSVAAQGWRAVTQAIRADAYRGKRVRFRGWVRAQAVSGIAGIWLRVDDLTHPEAIDSMVTRALTGTTGWKQVADVLDVPKDAVVIAFGPLMSGTGQMWMDDATLEVVDPKKVAVTGGWMGPDYSHDPLKPRNLDFSAAPQTPSRFDVPLWETNATGWTDAVHLDEKVRRNGRPTVLLHQKTEGSDGVALFQEIKAMPYRDKRVQFQVYVKSSGKVTGGPMLAIPGGGQWAVARISDLVERDGKWVPDTREWKPVVAVVDVPEWANCIQLGVQLDGPAQIWVSEGSFKIVDPRTTPVTYADPLTPAYTREELAKLPLTPVNLDMER